MKHSLDKLIVSAMEKKESKVWMPSHSAFFGLLFQFIEFIAHQHSLFWRSLSAQRFKFLLKLFDRISLFDLFKQRSRKIRRRKNKRPEHNAQISIRLAFLWAELKSVGVRKQYLFDGKVFNLFMRVHIKQPKWIYGSSVISD